jgi:hypothetical protein
VIPVWSALIGGALIGASASMMLALIGRTAGISGILAGALRPQAGETSWRELFIAGLFVGGFLLALLHPSALPADAGLPTVAQAGLAGILVGVGTRVGGGCTSGHGVCGISRLSVRSVVATISFMVTGVLATYVVRHVLTRGG